MDLYRYFHPLHDPKLHSTALRHQELGELEQAVSELRKALERAQQRTERKASPPIFAEHYTDIIKAASFIERSLRTLYDAHPGDDLKVMLQMIDERSDCEGWQTWASLLREQIATMPEKVPEEEVAEDQDTIAQNFKKAS